MWKCIESNPGLRSRFNKFIEFEDYSPKELYEIFVSFCTKAGYTFDETCGRALLARFESDYQTRDERFGNGRLVRNFIEQMIANQANRLAELPNTPTVEELQTLLDSDVPELQLDLGSIGSRKATSSQA